MARIRRGAAVWAALIDDWRDSGLSLAVFCERHGLNLGTMQGWVYKKGHRLAIEQARSEVRDEQALGENPSNAFLPVHLAEPIAITGPGVEVVLGPGRRIVVAPGFDTETFRRVVAVLEGRPC